MSKHCKKGIEELKGFSDSELQSVSRQSACKVERYNAECILYKRITKAAIFRVFQLGGQAFPNQIAEELVHDIAWFVFGKMTVEVIESVPAYTRDVAFKKFFAHVRSQAHKREIPVDFSDGKWIPLLSEDLESILIQRSSLAFVLGIAEDIEGRVGAVFRALHVELLSEKEACKILGLSAANLRVQRHKIRRILLKSLIEGPLGSDFEAGLPKEVLAVVDLMWRAEKKAPEVAETLGLPSVKDVRNTEKRAIGFLISYIASNLP